MDFCLSFILDFDNQVKAYNCLSLDDKTRQDPWSVEEKSYQDNGELHRKLYNFFKQEVKPTIRIGEKEHVRSELMNTNGNVL